MSCPALNLYSTMELTGEPWASHSLSLSHTTKLCMWTDLVCHSEFLGGTNDKQEKYTKLGLFVQPVLCI